MFGEIIVIESNQIEAIIQDDQASNNRASAIWKQLNEFHFTSLWEALTNSKIDDTQIKVLTSNDGETWVVAIPIELTKLIAERAEQDNSQIVSTWASSEEFKWGWSKSDISTLFNDLIKLATIANNNGQSLIYKGSL